MDTGTTFGRYLPLLSTLKSPEQDAAPLNSPAQGNEHILLVDDEMVLVTVGKQIIGGLGNDVTATTSAPEALAILRSDPKLFTLIITDQTMPELTGDQCPREALAIRPDIAVIICTGHSTKIDGASAKTLGVKALVMKPVYHDTWATIIREVLDEANGRTPATPFAMKKRAAPFGSPHFFVFRS